MDKKLPPPPTGDQPLVTPGWNDPPELPAKDQSHSIPSPRTRRRLNKRLPYPIPRRQSRQSDSAELNEIINNISSAINELPDNASAKKDMKRIHINWNDVAENIEITQLLLQVSKYIQEGDVIKAQDVHKQLSTIPAAGWFTLFFHSIIVLLNEKVA